MELVGFDRVAWLTLPLCVVLLLLADAVLDFLRVVVLFFASVCWPALARLGMAGVVRVLAAASERPYNAGGNTTSPRGGLFCECTRTQ